MAREASSSHALREKRRSTRREGTSGFSTFLSHPSKSPSREFFDFWVIILCGDL